MPASFIRHPDSVYGADKKYYFRRTYTFVSPAKATVSLFADARYKLWVNGEMVCFGPCKGNRAVRYYDVVDLTPFLKKGENLFFVEVLGLNGADNPANQWHIAAVYRGGNAGFAMRGTVIDDGQEKELITDENWECAPEDHLTFSKQFFVGMNAHVTLGYGAEKATYKKAECFDTVLFETEWQPFGQISSLYARRRPIPQMLYVPRKLSFHDGYYDAGEETCGFIRLRLSGKGKVTLTYGECFGGPEMKAGSPVKGDRTDMSRELIGHDDTFEVNGTLDFESFWFRTFRYIKVVTEGTAKVESLSYMETGYPLSVRTDYDFGREVDNQLWEISLRTLRRNMHETYSDCPYYEQLQYTMDTDSEIIFKYMITVDLRLPRRVIEELCLSYFPGFLTEARTPSCYRQYIPGFSLFYIFILYRYWLRSGDMDPIIPYIPVIDGILSWFARQRNELGLIMRSTMWDFVDWATPWLKDEGEPVTTKGEGITVYSMMYMVALREAAALMDVFGRPGVAEEYRDRARKMGEVVQEKTYDAGVRLYANSEKKAAFSQHAQIWAVLADLVKGEEAKDILRRSLETEAQGGFAYAWLWFRSLEKAGCYELGQTIQAQYEELVRLHCSTLPETPADNTRSECHAWSAVALFEYTSMLLGVKLSEETVDKILIRPRPDGRRDHAYGCVYTKFGPVTVDWQLSDGIFKMDVTAPTDAPVAIECPQGYADCRVTLNGEAYPTVFAE